MSSSSMKVVMVAVAGLGGMLAAGAAEPAAIQPQPLDSALRVFSERSGLQVVYLAEVSDGVRSPGAAAGAAPDAALRQLLADTGLDYRFVNPHTVAIEKAGTPGKAAGTGSLAMTATAATVAAAPEPVRLVQAQAPPAATPGGGTGTPATRQIEEIVVSTRQRQESLQTVPVAVDALTDEQIFRKGIASLADVAQQSPSLILDRGAAPQDLKIVVRGLSPTRGRQNVAVLLDGIDISSESLVTAGGSLLIDPKIFDIERIEVVKGPQNALYGRSAFAGAISYVSRAPGDTLEAGTDLDLGSDGQALVRARVSGPLTDTLSGGLNGMLWTHDGWYDNGITGAGVGGQEGASMAGTLVWRPDSTLTVTGRVSYEDSEHEAVAYSHPAPTVEFAVPQAALDAGIISPDITTVRGVSGTVPAADSLAITMGEDPRTGSDYPGDEQQVLRTTLTVAKDLAGLPLVGATRLTSLTHYADTDNFQFQDANDFGSPSVLPSFGEVWFKTDTTLFSQELRWQSAGDGPVNWTVGALYWQEQTDFLDGSFTCLAFFEPCGPYVAAVGTTLPRNPDAWFRDTDHWSAYGLVDWAFAPGWNVILEGRFVSEDLEVGGPDIDNSIVDPQGFLAGQPILFPAAAGVVTGSDDDSFFAPKATLQWQPQDGAMLYGSIAQGIKPSGISTVTGGVGAFDPDANRFESEKVLVYELGAKTDWLDQTLRVNGAVFFQDFTDKQVTGQVPDANGILRSKVYNANAEVWGLEADVTWLATEHLTLSAAYTWLDTEYTDFTQLTSSVGTISYMQQCEVVTFDVPTCRVSFNGNELENAPRNAFVGSASYRRALTEGMDWFVEADATYRGKRYTNQTNLLRYDDYWLADFRAGVSSDSWDVIAYVDNAFDDDTVKSGFNSGGYLNDIGFSFVPPFTIVIPDSGQYMMPVPRTWGVRVNYRFGG